MRNTVLSPRDLKRKFQEFSESKASPETRLSAARDLYSEIQNTELNFAKYPEVGGVQQIRLLHEVAGKVAASISRLEAGARRRAENDERRQEASW